MATEQIISPLSGNSPFPYQRAIEPTVWDGFDAIDFRRFWSQNYVEGATDAGAFAVHESTVVGLTVTVDADVAAALVQGDSVTDQGLYYVPPHNSEVTLDVPDPDASNPTVHRLVLRVYDNEHDGTGRFDAVLEWVAGTPTTGATLENEAGIGLVPDSALLLANVVVPAAATGITNSEIRDMRTYGLKEARVGDLRFSASGTPGAGWEKADGGTLNRKQHARAFAEWGESYGAGDGSTTFGKPDYRQRSPVGVDSDSGRGPARAAGDAGGEVNHTLTQGEMPPHNHPTTDPGHEHSLESYNAGGAPLSNPVNVATATTGSDRNLAMTATGAFFAGIKAKLGFTGLSVGNRGGGAAHNNMHPFQVCHVYVFTGSVAGQA